MGSASISDASQKALEPDLVDTGNRLLAVPSSTDELLILLEKAESLLSRVWQRPPKSTCNSLLPVMKALITNDILRHADLNIQVTVASCFNELTRITAPDPPYSDGVMRVFFRLFMIAFKQLPCESGLSYARALQILETMAKVRSCLMLMDIDTDGLIVEMFQIFLDSIRPTHPSDVFKYMEMIMTLVIEESDEISFELLRPLLASVKMDNKKTSPISWELGKKVIENCATKLQCGLKEAVKAMNLNIGDYAEIVTLIWRDTSSGKNKVSNEAAPAVDDPTSHLDGLPEAGHQECTPQINDGNGTKSDEENSSETLKGHQQTMQSAEGAGALRRKRGRKLNSVVRPEEGHRVLSEGYDEEEKDFSEPGNSSMPSDSSQKKSDSVNEVSLQKRGQLKKKVSTNNQHSDLEFSSGLKRRILQKKVKEGGSNGPKKKGTRAISGSRNKILSDTDTEEKQELLPEEHYRKKEIISRKHVRKEKMEEFPISKSAKAKNLKKEKEKKSRKSQVNHGEELVNSRIQVWWPMDKTFYAGTVKDFDPVTKKHTIMYDDDEIEILNLRKETWELIADRQPPQKQEADHPTPAKEPVKTQEKTAKRKTVSSKKHAALSSKRSKSENRSREISPPNTGYRIDESDKEMCETNVSTKDDGESHGGMEESNKLVKKTETGHDITEEVKKD
ncbi:hypothetical protein CDL12_09496 [Handroanthus impetiginosus]|uniref:Uncharacterized protein n=1 Tax=Handroanthus impetiginosus TaxID=429701 RepID=A0A2G9HJY1_9LAMI|nr:hypothetical protein CDL12_09496 [Handroanthus impetiginosus]